MTALQPDSSRWLEKAADDLRWAEASLKAEKSLKAFLLCHGKSLRKIHDLSSLLEECIEIDSGFEKLIDQAATLSGYYVEARYPDIGDFMGYTRDQSEEALGFADDIVAFVSKKLGIT